MSEKPTFKFTDAEKLEEVKKEIAFRWGVYTKQVRNGRMTQAAMDKKIALMQAIRDDYQRLVDGRML